ncbi:nickel-dependent hydrogenase large subunit [Sulfurimonas sp. SAG-AH-194-I05]|nr:nickel-dependent hydrogenase large subunit [Sulfurimonas sp. SAG-AH-194-I05]MDF1875172.1 nickel-dependent hydrogenase large subunit [Sulfurimonas sp. SAG-AH-194-I05]
MTTKQLVEQIEGEASVYFDTDDEKVVFSTIAFPHFRGMENILKGKNALDALVITPRVCGICGHAHLMACVRAIEDAYKNAGESVVLSKKAENIREFTVVMEIIQNHLKWIYFVLLPELYKRSDSKQTSYPLKGAFGASLATKAIALLGGQWPHSSYMVPGGITCDPTYIEILQAQGFLEELIAFFEKESLGVALDDFLAYETCKEFAQGDADIAKIEAYLLQLGMHEKGLAYDRFIVLGKHQFSRQSKIKQTRFFSVDSKYVSTVESFSPNEKTFARNALYKDEYYEVGSLSRMMSLQIPLIKNIHRRYKDSAYSRVMARVYEVAHLMKHVKELLSEVRIDENSFNKPAPIETLTASGVGIVEAPRGPLIHKIDIEKGMIKNYEIITPTQWNIGSSNKNKLTPVQKTMQGHSKTDALFIFRTFDVCSVCTTH